MNKKTVYVIFIILLCVSRTIEAQPPSDARRIPLVDRTITSCDTNRLELNQLNLRFTNDELVVIIAYLAKGENGMMAKRRLNNAFSFLTNEVVANAARSVDSIITAESVTEAKRGHVDFYVKDQLQLRIHLAKNADLLVSRCVQDKNEPRCPTPTDRRFYPCKRN